MSHTQHRAAARRRAVRCAVVTVSDTRTPDTDLSGSLMKARLAEAGHPVAAYHVVPDDPAAVGALLEALAGTVDAVLFNGGTGISPRDTTYEAVAGRLEKTLPGFGELFRMLSYEDVGAAAMLSRAVAGLYRGSVVFATPGSPAAVRLAMERLIVPELAHLVGELRKGELPSSDVPA